MGKRSDKPRRYMDDYPTPRTALPALWPFIQGIRSFAEPCAGDGQLASFLQYFGMRCTYAGDIRDGQDALGLDRMAMGCPEAIISNPPWTRKLLHPLIAHFQGIAPTWLLLDADWAHTVQAAPYLDHCSHIVSIGRVKWIDGSPHTGKDNAAWYRFDQRHADGPRFFGRASNQIEKSNMEDEAA